MRRRPRVVVLDYGSGNVRSAQRALERVGADVRISADADEALDADGLVVPGVGAFAACMSGLTRVGAVEVLRKRLETRRPIFGICVGFQVLFGFGVEHGVRSDGIGFWPGGVEQLRASILPHMGWNTVAASDGSVLFRGVEHERFYFVHSYAPHDAAPTATWCRYDADRFLAAAEDGVVVGTQFHPEKSGDAGAAVLRNWLEAWA
ncbi:MAG: imidazole glycerol phosphate synthase subunit HisH [Acidothermus sp.]|nr:imidazole glycerol phosphate synthase subunit HisH [Acidothermus sp.]MCL6537743.1 imidazole glycerol phosphate synthase subunit HisH [Acidothermus sp.]